MRMMHKFIVLALAPVVLAGCLGGKNAPDATLVADAPSLVIPANFELRPPRTDDKGNIIAPAVNPAAEQVRRDAQNILIGGEAPKAETAKPKENWLLEKAGAGKRNASIRELMQNEAVQAHEKEQSQGWFSRNFGKKGDLKPVDDVAVDEEEVKY